MRKPVVLVTGAANDVGRLTVEALAPHAHTLHVASLGWTGHDAPNVHRLSTDLRNSDCIRAAVEGVLAHSGRIDVLVNLAGQRLCGLLEEIDTQSGRDLFETNFWAAVETSRRVLPAMRAQRSGRIVLLGSLAGRVAPPGQGFYAASKFALAGFAESLACEVQSFGISVHMVEPSFHRAEVDKHLLWAGYALDDYDPIRTPVQQAITRSVMNGEDPRNIAHAIVDLALGRRRDFRLPVGSEARWVPRLRAMTPGGMFLRKMRQRFGIR